MPHSSSPLHLFARFLGFGCRAFGGPVAQIDMLRRELVEEEGWVDPARFTRLLAVYQALPGPEAHELCVHLGIVRGGRLGGVLAGLGFLLPGLLLTLALAALYARLDLAHPLLAAALVGAQLAVIALILVAASRIGRHVVKGTMSIAAAAVGTALALLLPAPVVDTATSATSGSLGLAALFLAGLKGGLLSFGGAYAAIPVVRADLVGPDRLSDAVFLDGVAFANLLPAPLILFGTFAAYQLGGMDGALAMTIGLFLPAFGFGLVLFERLEGLLEARSLHRLLDFVAAVAVGLMTGTALRLLLASSGKPEAVIILLASLAALLALRSRHAAPVVLAGAALGHMALAALR